MSVTSEPAKLYRTSHGRRYITKRAAFLNEALYRLKRKDRHEPAGVHDELLGGEHYQDIFYTTEQYELFGRIAQRYYRRFGRRVA